MIYEALTSLSLFIPIFLIVIISILFRAFKIVVVQELSRKSLSIAMAVIISILLLSDYLFGDFLLGDLFSYSLMVTCFYFLLNLRPALLKTRLILPTIFIAAFNFIQPYFNLINGQQLIIVIILSTMPIGISLIFLKNSQQR